MHLALVPGLLLTLIATIFTSAPAHREGNVHSGYGVGNKPILFSVAAQATTTATLTTVTTTSAAATVSGTITETGLSATATLTSAVQSTPVPLPTSVPQVSFQGNPFDPNFLFSVPSPPLGPLAWAYLALMVALLAVSGYFMVLKRPEWKRTNSVLYRAVNRWGPVGLWVAIPGILLLLFRRVAFDFFNLRFWLYLWTIALLVAIGWFFYWYRVRYPKEIAKYQKSQRARQYIPGAASKTAMRQAAQPKSKSTSTTEAGDQPRPTTTAASSQSRSSQKSGKRTKRK